MTYRTKKEKQLGKRYYDHMTDNDPIIHSNRFPLWSELDDATKEQYIKEALKENVQG